MTKEKHKRSRSQKLYVIRDKSGRITDTYTVVRPKKGPTSVSLSDIRTAISKTYAARKGG
jgi:hypothetical protein